MRALSHLRPKAPPRAGSDAGVLHACAPTLHPGLSQGSPRTLPSEMQRQQPRSWGSRGPPRSPPTFARVTATCRLLSSWTGRPS